MMAWVLCVANNSDVCGTLCVGHHLVPSQVLLSCGQGQRHCQLRVRHSMPDNAHHLQVTCMSISYRKRHSLQVPELKEQMVGIGNALCIQAAWLGSATLYAYKRMWTFLNSIHIYLYA